MKDYYEILRVHPSVSQDEIKDSYRRLAHKYHPDMEKGDAEQFKNILEAYTVLSDPYRRGVYDTQSVFEYTQGESTSVKEKEQSPSQKGMGGWGWFIFAIIIVFIIIAINS